MLVNCPFCQERLEIAPDQAGSTASCPKCNGKFQVPVPMAGGGGSSLNPEMQAFASKKVAAGICGILLGGFGVHKFILGMNIPGIIMLSVSLAGIVSGVCLCFPYAAWWGVSIIGLIEGIIYLTKTDEEFYQTYAVNKKEWF